MNFYKKIIIFNVIAFVLFLSAGGWVIYKFNRFIHTKASENKQKVYIEINKGEHIYDIVRKLKKDGIITRSDWFYYYIRLSSADKKIKAGVHLFYKNYTPKEVLKELESSNIYSVKVRVVEGWTIDKIANLLTSKGFDGDKFIQLADNSTLSKQLTGLNIKTLEGLLFPDTYYFSKNEKPLNIIYVMFDRFKNVFNKITNRHYLNKNDYKKLIVASIIEKEASDDKDKPLVASVIYNRLKKNMYLQMDSTVIYGDKTFNGSLTKSALKSKDNRYNTYVYKGLPQTPICNPSESSIYAAYNPAKTDYLFFISNKDKMIFSKTFKEHIRWIKKYKVH